MIQDIDLWCFYEICFDHLIHRKNRRAVLHFKKREETLTYLNTYMKNSQQPPKGEFLAVGENAPCYMQ